jgi:hypothetical protein
MKKQCIKQASHTGIEADHPAPKLHLVKGGSQPDDICEQLGLSHPNEMKPCFSETNKQEKSLEHLQAIADVKLFREKKITATELRKKYKKTYTNWTGMKQRCKGNLQKGEPPIFLHQSLSHFADCLELMGPRPYPDWSIDRIDHTGSYEPDNVRWADKKTQSRNRSNTVFMTVNGVKKPLTAYAEENGVDPSLYRQRKRLGWSDEEIIEGHRAIVTYNQPKPQTSRDPWPYTPWPTNKREMWEQMYQRWGRAGEHRLSFMKRFAQEYAAATMQEIEECWYPEDHTPSPAEAKRLKELSMEHDGWLAVFNDSRQKLDGMYKSQPYGKIHIPEWAEGKLRTLAYPTSI